MSRASSEQQEHSCECLPPVGSGRVSFELFTEGDRLYVAMREAIAAAREEILLESFIFAADEVGWEMAEALAERARAGVAVRLHLDAAGCLHRMSRGLASYLRTHGVELRWFHRWSWRHPFRYYLRNHRKQLVLDREEVFLGGFNLHRENSRRYYGETRWRDTHVRVRGELASRAAAYFDRLWRGVGASAPGALPEHPGSLPGALLVATPSRRCRRRLVCLYESLLDDARRRVYLTTPYFGPGHALRDALRRAAARGVDVRLLVPGRPDPRFTGWVTRSFYDSLLAAGVRIYELAGRRLHAKTTVVDDEWASVGSVNLDELSLFVNQELLLLARSPALAGALERSFRSDLGEGVEICPSRWAARGRRARVLEGVGGMIRPLV